MSNYKHITTCRCCGGCHMHKYLNLGQQPLANSYHKGETLPRFPLEIMLCDGCFHSQLSIVVNPEMMFQHYLYVSGTTKTFRTHCEELAADAKSRVQRPSPRVLDIACNDGTLLECFRSLGCHVYGVDPAQNLRQLTADKDIPVVTDYWGRGTASKKLTCTFDIITGTNVFAHVDNVSAFLDECLSVLAHDGVIALEFPYCTSMITHCEFDTIYHEHLSYFLVNSFSTLVHGKGLVIADIVRTPIHGGSIRFYLRTAGTESPKVAAMIAEERSAGLLSAPSYFAFAEQVERNKQDMLQLVADLRRSDILVVGYGASAKGNTMLNYFELDLDYIVDDNPMKWGYKTPGRDIPILKPTELQNSVKSGHDLAIVILSWNFFDEIVAKIEAFIGSRATYINYVPTVTKV